MLITANFGSARTGLATVGYKILNADKSQYAARTTTGVTELGGGVYAVTVANSDLAGRYVVWDSGQTPAVYAAEGFGAVLADDAITAAKFDESTAFPLKSADTGATAVARTGADADTLETLSDELVAMKGATFDGSTDSLEAVRNRGDAAWVTATGFSTHSPADVKTALEAAGSHLTTIKTVTDAQGAAGAGLTAVPWNAAWDAEVQSECTDALNAYDPPTNAEMEARTIVANDYLLATDTLARVTLVDTCTTNTDMVAEAPSTTDIKTALEAAGSSIAAILEDTGTTLDGLVKDIPTNAELTTALAGADDAVLAAITAAHSTTDGKIDVVDGIADSILADTAFVKKWILDKLVGTDNGDGTITYVLYDDDNTTPLKTWVYTTVTGTRAAAT